MAEVTISTPGSRVAVEVSGNGFPVVLLHGLTATRRYVVMGSKLLERSEHRVVAYDARGHGESQPAASPSEYRYSDLADDLAAVLDTQGIDRAVLAGASMGAHTIINLALATPERVAGMVLITPAFAPDVDQARSIARYQRLATGLREGGIEGFVAAYGEPAVSPQLRETVLMVIRQRLGAHRYPDAVADALEAVPPSRPFEKWKDLEALSGIPTTVVASNDEADPEHPFAVAQSYADAIAGAQLRTEDRGKSPLAWQGAQLSRVIAETAQRSAL